MEPRKNVSSGGQEARHSSTKTFNACYKIKSPPSFFFIFHQYRIMRVICGIFQLLLTGI